MFALVISTSHDCLVTENKASNNINSIAKGIIECRGVSTPNHPNSNPSKFTSTLICYPAVASKEVQGIHCDVYKKNKWLKNQMGTAR